MKRKAFTMISGGLDSLLAARLLLDQGIPVTAVRFTTDFGCDGAESSPAMRLVRGLETLWAGEGFRLEIRHLGQPYIDLVKAPRFQVGKNMNPCIDCKVLMMREVKAMMEAEDACCVATGEVLNQRPLSQTRPRLEQLERESGLQGRLLRPLSARLLEPTLAEKEGLIDRERLLNLSGRGRKAQEAMARSYGITDFLQPAGGCLLTDPHYSARLRELLNDNPDAGEFEFRLLRLGRHFRAPSGGRIVVGRNEKDNAALEAIARPGDLLLNLSEQMGPMVLLPGGGDEADRQTAAALTVRYGDVPNRREGGEGRVWIRHPGESGAHLTSQAMRDEALESMRLGKL